ncbi:head-tail connector protein [Clostridium butyricum]|uniref:Phage gp6-like head-tail connector protein n=1 Tax=Clostridium butyricum E4 str. BoNT E BL5262 TaxID=632245 RepID=C4II32_CLOBU|nr:head-tail connector protein [Clostridium butyricum]EDT75850.1 conserved hypothetical protein [Clostridium butyricum 5521]EEP54207.1 conserved hypothetical protein [Clostridium butyricum E4 str. BoNT E BL5262]NFL33218.1 phage gp6-like head-tail connector protein [Clostridium butyricum]NFS20420.1 phage gp6-like head-tail connector protein [Clostridium butyricum]
MKVSEMTLDDIKNYIRLDSDDDDSFLDAVLIGAISFIRSYTGLTDAQIDEKEELTLPVYVLCAEMYDNRQFTIDKGTLNPIIKSILSMHCVNLL